MTADELDALLAVAQARGCAHFRIGPGGEVEASWHPQQAPRAVVPIEAIAPGEPLPTMGPAEPKTPEEQWDAVARRMFPEDQA